MSEKYKNIWFPFTSMKNLEKPLEVESGKGTKLFLKDGRTIIDAVASWWVNIHGHANEHISNALSAQSQKLEHVIFAGFTHDPALDLAEKVLELLPPQMDKVFYTDNGSTAVEVALKMAIQYWDNLEQPKHKVIAFKNAYHGDTFGAMSVAERGAFNKAFHNLLFDVEFVDIPTKENFSELKEQFKTITETGEVACFIFEPLVQGAGGMLMYEAEYLDKLINIAHQNEVICIADEVMTGFGRTGKLFASQYLENFPDIMCMSKGLTAGYLPLGVTVCNEKVFSAYDTSDKMKTLFHGHSYTANPLSCTCGVASLEVFNQPETQENWSTLPSKLSALATTIQSETNCFTNFRQTGNILAFDIKTGEQTSYFNNIRDIAYNYFLEKGILMRPLGNTLYLIPPYCITVEELKTIEEAILGLEEVLKA